MAFCTVFVNEEDMFTLSHEEERFFRFVLKDVKLGFSLMSFGREFHIFGP